MKCTISLLVLVLFATTARSQNIPMGSLPLLYNGGFAGESSSARVYSGLSYLAVRYAGDSARDICGSAYVSYDRFVPKIRSGLGLTFIQNDLFNRSGHTRYQRGTYDNYFVIASLSPKLSFKGKYTFAPFINIIFSSMLLPVLNFDITSQTYTHTTKKRLSLWTQKIGFMFNSSKFYIGFSMSVFGKDSETYTNELHTYPSKKRLQNRDVYPISDRFFLDQDKNLTYHFQAGYTFQKTPESKFSVTPQVAVQSVLHRKLYPWPGGDFVYEKRSERIDLSLAFRYDKLLWSLNNNGLGIGYQNGNSRILVSQNLVFVDRTFRQISVTARHTVGKNRAAGSNGMLSKSARLRTNSFSQAL
jgi:hypothetical protein